MAIIKLRDTNGNIVEIPSIKGDTPKKGVDYWNEADKEEVQGFIDTSVLGLENLLRDILATIQAGGTTGNTVAEIEQLLVSYLKTKTVREVEGR